MGSAMVAPVTFDSEDRALFRTGGIAGILIALAYPVIVALFVVAGTPLPVGKGGEAWLTYLSGNQASWWAIVGLSVITNILWLPVALAVYRALKAIGNTGAMAGAGLMVLFVVLELATSWSNYAVLIDLSYKFEAAAGEVERAAVLAAASYGSALQSSSLLPYYAIVIPAVSKLVLGLLMFRGGPFGRIIAWLGVLEAILAILSVVGAYFVAGLGQAIILASLLSGLWFLLVGLRLVRQGGTT